MSTSDNQTVKYSIKDLLEKIDKKLDEVTRALNSKADHVDLVMVQTRLDVIEREGCPSSRNIAKEVTELKAKATELSNEMASQNAIKEVLEKISSNRKANTYTIIALVLQFAGFICYLVLKR